MFRQFCFVVLIIFTGIQAKAQSADAVYDQYLDFNLARLQGDENKLLSLGEAVLPNADKLPEKARLNFYYAIGKVYEDNNQPDKAMPFYERVAAAVPDYYVAQRALGYLYLDKVKAIETKLNASVGNKALNAQLTIAYNQAVQEALPHLEKAQACDPSDETLAIIKILYKNMKDTAGANSLDSRLKAMSKNCIDILPDK